jgi:uncharacterized protein (TIGR02117 family)
MINVKYLKILGILIAPFMLYLLGALLGQLIAFKGETSPQEFPLYISSGDIHTEFVFDLENSPFNWKGFIAPELIYKKESSNIRYISLGQGDQRFFYEFLKPDDLTFGLAIHGAFIPSQTVIHVDYSERLSPSLRYYKFTLGRERYLKLVDFIRASFYLENGGPVKVDDFNYYGTDGFFWGTEKYHLFNTCNMWTARGLEVVNLPRPLWAPFRYSIDHALKDFEIR